MSNGGAAQRSGAALAAWKRVAAPVGRLLSPALRRTSLLLLFIWFTNALNYYGLVLLTTTVRHKQGLLKRCLGDKVKGGWFWVLCPRAAIPPWYVFSGHVRVVCRTKVYSQGVLSPALRRTPLLLLIICVTAVPNSVRPTTMVHNTQRTLGGHKNLY